MTGTETTKCFADRLQDLIKESGKDLKTLADEIGISSGALSKYQNDNGEPGISALYKIANYFGVTADYLIGLSDNKTVENASIGQVTGLSDGAIQTLEKMNAAGNYYVINDIKSGRPIYWKEYMVALNGILENDRLPSLLDFMKYTVHENFMYKRLIRYISNSEDESSISNLSARSKDRFEWALWRLEKESAEILRSVIDEMIERMPEGFYDDKGEEGDINADNTKEE